MLILSALLRAVYLVLRLGVRVAGSVEVGRPYRKWTKSDRQNEWDTVPFKADEVDWYATVPQTEDARRRRYKRSQPIDTTTGLPSGEPSVVGPQEPS
jgi:hypothetical protein